MGFAVARSLRVGCERESGVREDARRSSGPRTRVISFQALACPRRRGSSTPGRERHHARPPVQKKSTSSTPDLGHSDRRGGHRSRFGPHKTFRRRSGRHPIRGLPAPRRYLGARAWASRATRAWRRSESAGRVSRAQPAWPGRGPCPSAGSSTPTSDVVASLRVSIVDERGRHRERVRAG
jgi:hypothetical protein